MLLNYTNIISIDYKIIMEPFQLNHVNYTYRLNGDYIRAKSDWYLKNLNINILI
jgi:hypothetical protein